MNLTVRTTREADRQVRTIDDWWQRNRSAAPDLFLDELASAFTLIGHAPQAGHPYRRSPIPGTRRVLLARSRYHVYYIPLDDEVLVLAVWHARRGGGPPLRLE